MGIARPLVIQTFAKLIECITLLCASIIFY